MKICETPCSVTPLEPSAIDILAKRIRYTNKRVAAANQRINNTNSNVSYISTQLPYEESKLAYIYDTAIKFDKVKEGAITVNCVAESGKQIPVTFDISDSEVVVHFEELTECATVTMCIQ